MKNRKSMFGLWATTTLILLGTVGWLAVSRRSKASTTSASASSSAEASTNDNGEMAALRAQLDALRSEQTRTRARLENVAAQSRGAKTESAASKEAEPLTDEELRKRDYAASKHIAEYVENALRLEPTDPNWGPARGRELQEAFKGFALAGFKFDDAECKSTLCRVTIKRAENAITQELGGEVIKLEPFKKMGAYFHYEDDHVVLYSPREGHPFPKDPTLASR